MDKTPTHPPRNGLRRPLLPYLGSKWRIAPQIVAHFPPHRTYLEPFGGGGAVLLCKPPAPHEVYNDLNGDLVNLFTVLRTQPGELLRALRRTPYAEAEYRAAFCATRHPVEQARRLLIRAHMGFHSRAVFGEACTWKLYDGRGGSPAASWARQARALPRIVQRLRHVTLSQRPALQVIEPLDAPDTLIYADPPYLTATRKSGSRYCYEMADADHRALLERLLTAKSRVVLSGYAHPLYDELLRDWQRVVIKTQCFSVGKQSPAEEVLWINPAAVRGRQNT